MVARARRSERRYAKKATLFQKNLVPQTRNSTRAEGTNQTRATRDLKLSCMSMYSRVKGALGSRAWVIISVAMMKAWSSTKSFW